MRIGFDFDNTMVNYDALFHKVSIEQSLAPPSLPKSKLAVRDYLLKTDNENAWTKLQGYVYGARMNEATAYPGLINFLKLAHSKNIPMFIASHKTKTPFMGPKYDLHEAARKWVKNYLVDGYKNLIEPTQIFFELTKKDKVARIAQCGCDYFVDDLPEILLMPEFSKETQRILFDPDNNHSDKGMSKKFRSWQEISFFFEAKWKACG